MVQYADMVQYFSKNIPFHSYGTYFLYYTELDTIMLLEGAVFLLRATETRVILGLILFFVFYCPPPPFDFQVKNGWEETIHPPVDCSCII